MNRLTTNTFLFIWLSLMLFSCRSPEACDKNNATPRDLSQIMDRDTLVAVTSTNSTDYFVYRGKPMGFHLELLEKFTEHIGVELQVIVENNIDKSISLIQQGKADVLAQSLTISNFRKTKIAFTIPITETKQVLVQRICDTMITSTLDLGHRTIYIQKSSVFNDRLINLSNEIAKPITIIQLDSLEVEEIIAKVANGEFAYTVCDESVALINQQYYSNINASLAVSLDQHIAWAVRKSSNILLDSLNIWINNYTQSIDFIHLYNKYYKHTGLHVNVQSNYFSGAKGQISDYDEWIKKYSKQINWDWRLLASLIYQESRFNPNAKSWAGAYGIMQIMPSTAETLNIDSLSGIEAQIAAGVRLIQMIDAKVSQNITDTSIRQKYILAGYNVGYGHVEDAIRLAEKYGDNPEIWENNVAKYLINLSGPDYYTDSVVQFGYCNGIHPVRYIKEIFERYEHYKNVIPE
jgi:membrane-bound lytic murein transglycosylase F